MRLPALRPRDAGMEPQRPCHELELLLADAFARQPAHERDAAPVLDLRQRALDNRPRAAGIEFVATVIEQLLARYVCGAHGAARHYPVKY